MIRFISHHPAPPLAACIDSIWYYEGSHTPHSFERILPRGALQLLINLHDDPLRVYDPDDQRHWQNLGAAAFVGAYDQNFVIDTLNQQQIIGVAFHPGGAFPFLAPPVDALYNTHVALEDLWPDVRDVREQILAAPTPAAKLRALERALLARLCRPPHLHPAVAFALRELTCVPQPRPIAAVIDQIGLSQRHFIQLFSQQVGLTPKRFCRVQRFQASLCQIHTADEIDWLDVAHQCGYYDQAHFNHDFQAFAGFSPTTYLHGRGHHRNHIAL